MGEPRARRRLLFFASDGMRHDLMLRYVAAGQMPVVAGLIAGGAIGMGGCLPALPTNTGAGWATLQTGAWSGTSGALNNVFHAAGTPITEPSSGFDARLLQAETLAQAAERQGLTVACVEWPGTLPATCAGPVIDFRTFYSTRGALLRHDPPNYRPEIAARLGLADLRSPFPPASGWSNAPRSVLPPREATLTIASTRPDENPDRVYHVYVYASGAAGYDRVLVAEAKDGDAAVATLRPGAWAPVRVRLRDGRLAGFHFKLIALAPDLSQCWLAFSTISRARASRPDLEDLLASEPFAVPETADHGPIEAGLVDAETYVEQGLMFYANAEHVYRHVVETYRPDILFAGAPVTDEFSHQFMACVTPAYPGYDAAAAPRYEGYLRAAYSGADTLLGQLVALMPQDTIVALSADHGFGAAWRSINANLVLERSGLLVSDAEGRPLPESRAVAFWAGATCSVYVNLAGREPGGVVRESEHTAVCEQIRAAFAALNAAGTHAIDAIYSYDEAGAIPTSCGTASMRFPGRTGDVVIFAAPPHQFDAPALDRLIAPSPLLGQHGYLPDTVDERLNVNMRPPLVLAGPGVPKGLRLPGARAIDLAPTLAALLDIAPPAQADGRDLLAGER